MQQLLLPLLLMLVVAVPLVMGTRKQKRAAAQQQELQASLAEGDRVMTTSGLYGTIADASGETTIDVEIAPGVVTTWLRQAVREKVEPVIEDVDALDESDTAIAHEQIEETPKVTGSAGTAEAAGTKEESIISSSSNGFAPEEDEKKTASAASSLDNGKK